MPWEWDFYYTAHNLLVRLYSTCALKAPQSDGVGSRAGMCVATVPFGDARDIARILDILLSLGVAAPFRPVRSTALRWSQRLPRLVRQIAEFPIGFFAARCPPLSPPPSCEAILCRLFPLVPAALALVPLRGPLHFASAVFAQLRLRARGPFGARPQLGVCFDGDSPTPRRFFATRTRTRRCPAASRPTLRPARTRPLRAATRYHQHGFMSVHQINFEGRRAPLPPPFFCVQRTRESSHDPVGLPGREFGGHF